jgi:hypothetical protein
MFANGFTEFVWQGFCGMLLFFVGIPCIAAVIHGYLEERKKAKAAAEEARFQREHPEAWKAREQIKLQKELIDQENSRHNAGLVAGIVRAFWQ